LSNTTPQIDRYLAAMREIVRQELARSLFGVYEYVVQPSSSGNTVDIVPADTSTGAPNISGLVIWMGVPGSTCTPFPGSHLAVVFLDGNRAKPRVIAFDATATFPGLTPNSIVLGGSSPSPPVPVPGAVARVGDAAGPFLVTTGSSRVSAG